MGGAKGVRIFGPPLPTVSIVVHHAVLLLYTLHPFTDEFVFPCRKVSVTFMGKLVHFAFAGILIVCGGYVKQGHTALGHICLIGRVQDIVLASTGFISRQNFNTSYRCCSQVDRSRACTGFGSSWGPALGLTATARSRTQSRMNSMSSNNSLLIHARMLNSRQKRRSRTVSTVEKGTWCVCAWKESIQQRENWR